MTHTTLKWSPIALHGHSPHCNGHYRLSKMSNKARDWAWAQDVPSTTKIVLLCLAELHKENTRAIDVPQYVIKDMTGLCSNSVYRHLYELERRKLLFIVQRFADNGAQIQSSYSLQIKNGII